MSLCRTSLAAAHDRAETAAKLHDIKLVAVAAAALGEQRDRMVAEQDKVANKIRNLPDLVARIIENTAVGD